MGGAACLASYLDQLGLVRRARHLVADGGFAGQLIDWAHPLLQITIEVVCKPAGQRGVAVIGRRWVVERTDAWGSPRTAGWLATTNATPPTAKR